MNELSPCPQCGAALPENAPEGICPACLLRAGLSDPAMDALESGSLPTSSPNGSFIPPSPEELDQAFPRLEIQELIGRGGMGAVYRARQTELDRIVALKILPPDFGADPGFAQRFTREAQALAKLSHQNIVAVFDFGQVQGQYYFIMEFVHGANLRQLMQVGGISPDQALSIVNQICEALQFAHQQGVVHRDIKPENILVDLEGRVKIADFGLAKLVGRVSQDVSLTATEQVMGTPRYMAPEQMMGTKNVDHRADIFSLGVIFYELLTGELPVGRFDPPSKMRELDQRLDEIVLRALEREPDRRYQQASELSVEIESIPPGAKSAGKTDNQMKGVQMNQPNPKELQSAGYTSPYGGELPATSFPNYGLMILGGMMILLGLPMLGIAFLTPSNPVFIWIGLGNTLGGGALFSLTFLEETRWPAGTPTNYAALFAGFFMSTVGLGMLILRLATIRGELRLDPSDVFIWIGIGLFLGGGGICTAAWMDDKQGTRK